MTDHDGDGEGRPPWWHDDLAGKVDALDVKLDGLQADVEQVRGILRLVAGVGTLLIVAGTIAGPIILLVHH